MNPVFYHYYKAMAVRKTKKKVAKKKVAKKKATAKSSAKSKITKKKPQSHAKWHDHYLDIIENLLKDGRTVLDICCAFNVSKQTFYNWKKEFFSKHVLDSIKEWTEEADREIENSLYRRAKGYNKVVETQVRIRAGNYESVKKLVEVPGDVNAQRYWLNNRKRKEWSEKNEKDHSGGNDRERSYGFTFNDDEDPL